MEIEGREREEKGVWKGKGKGGEGNEWEEMHSCTTYF